MLSEVPAPQVNYAESASSTLATQYISPKELAATGAVAFASLERLLLMA